MSAPALVFSGPHPREATQVKTTARSRAREVESCDGLAFDEYSWHVARLTDPDTLEPEKREIFLSVHRGGPQVPTGRIPATCGTFDIREEAEAACRDEWDYLYREPHGLLLKADRASGPENFCRPLWEQHTLLNLRERQKFAHEAAEANQLREFLLRWRDELQAAAPSPPEGR